MRLTDKLPRDDALPGLKLLNDWKRLMKEVGPNLLPSSSTSRLMHVGVIRYRPGRRLVARLIIDEGNTRSEIYAKLYYNDRGATIAASLSALRQSIGPGVLRIVRPIIYIKHARMLLLESARGEPLPAELTSRNNSAGAVADAIRQLHSSPRIKLRTWEYRQELKILCNRLTDLGRFVPDLRTRADNLASGFGDIFSTLKPAQANANIHRDLYPENILIYETAKGTEVWTIDLDDITSGDPLIDVANLIAEVRLEGLLQRQDLNAFEHWNSRFLSIYLSDETPENDRKLQIFQAVTLARNSGINAQREDLRWTCQPLLAAAEEILKKSSA